jgi:hypothetical protein
MRIVFAVNAAYQLAFGTLCVLWPATAVAMYGGNILDRQSMLLLVTFRLIGVNLIPAGVISAVVAADPDRHPILRALMGLVATLTLVCWGIVIGMHDLNAGQIAAAALDIVMHVALLVGVMGYYPHATLQQVVVRRQRLAA